MYTLTKTGMNRMGHMYGPGAAGKRHHIPAGNTPLATGATMAMEINGTQATGINKIVPPAPE